MTDIPEATVEAVARAFCKRIGLDPDEVSTVKKADPTLYGLVTVRARTCTNWRHSEKQAREAIAMQLALHDAGIKGE